MNNDAGRGNWLFVTLRFEGGEELPFFVDTGAVTFLDKSLESKLGRRLSTTTASGSSLKHTEARYAAPRLFLGNTRLMTGSYVLTRDLTAESSYAGRPVMGVLGIDCLKHYCIQLDFEAGKIRFLNPNELGSLTLGKALPLYLSENTHRPFLRNSGLIQGAGTNTLIDTGYDADAALNSQDFRRELRDKRLIALGTPARGREPGFALLPKCVWKDHTYTNLIVGNDWNALGLRFLARHLVTLNFPKAIMYLKQTSIGPLIDENVEAGMKFLMNLKNNGQVPGWSKDDQGEVVGHPRSYSDFVSVSVRKKGDSTMYHYRLTRGSKDNPWKLQRAWRTDQNGQIIEEYAIPEKGSVNSIDHARQKTSVLRWSANLVCNILARSITSRAGESSSADCPQRFGSSTLFANFGPSLPESEFSGACILPDDQPFSSGKNYFSPNERTTAQMTYKTAVRISMMRRATTLITKCSTSL